MLRQSPPPQGGSADSEAGKKNMSTIKIEAAMKRLTSAVEQMQADDILQVYNELFPNKLVTEDELSQNLTCFVEQIHDHMKQGLEPEEVVDLWNVVFPMDRGVSFDEEENLLVYEEPSTTR